jgi:hypothetical protein
MTLPAEAETEKMRSDLDNHMIERTRLCFIQLVRTQWAYQSIE